MRKTLFLLITLWSAGSAGQVPVVEAGTNAGGRARTAAPAAAAPGGNELVMSMYNQLEALQQEVQTLRGRVEEQDYQIKRMQTEQRDRYLDIDRRLSAGSQTAPIGVPPFGPSGTSPPPPSAETQIPSVRNSAPPQVDSNAGVAANTTPQQVPQAALPNTATPASTPAAAAQMDEQELYRTALNLLLEQSNYEQSIQYFQTYITTYPQGRYLTNSYYWQGEAFILVGKFREAEDVFLKIIDGFPQDPKAAGAMLKLGVVYQEMGDDDQARKTWQDIAARYPENTTEIREAANHLRRQ